jgi:hypothetical protein
MYRIQKGQVLNPNSVPNHRPEAVHAPLLNSGARFAAGDLLGQNARQMPAKNPIRALDWGSLRFAVPRWLRG